MSIRFKCPCSKTLSVPEEFAGKKARCPSCTRLLRIPVTSSSKPSDEEAKPEPAAAAGGGVVAEAPPEEPSDKYKGKVVLGESTPQHREFAEKMLQDHGYKVFTAEDGEKAVELVRAHKPDVAMIDLKTERLGGFQVVQTLRDQFDPRNVEVWQTPIIMTASKITGRDKQYAISLGVKHYYPKPLKPATVCARIEKLMGRLPSGMRHR